MSAEGSALRGVFITGTDTGVGKTLVAAALARFLSRRNLRVGVMKPLETGVPDPETLGPDGELLQWAAGSADAAELVSPYRLREPVAPSVAAEAEGVRIDFSRFRTAAETLAREHDFLIVEGAGGLMVPIAGGLLMADLVRDLGLPLLTVSRCDLGTINHTLLTVFAARTMELPMAGMVISGMPEMPDTAQRTAPHILASLASADLLGVFGRVEGDERRKIERMAAQIEELPSLPWLLRNLGIEELPSNLSAS